MLATFGVILFLNQGVKAVFGTAPMQMPVPELLSGGVRVMDGLLYPTYRVAILVAGLATAGLLAFAAAPLTAADTAPKSVIHVVTVSFKADAKPEQIKAALDGVKALPAAYKGITRVWTRAIKVQGGKTHAIVMEFADEAALKAYTDSPAQKDWYKLYIPGRDSSTTFDVTN